MGGTRASASKGQDADRGKKIPFYRNRKEMIQWGLVLVFVILVGFYILGQANGGYQGATRSSGVGNVRMLDWSMLIEDTAGAEPRVLCEQADPCTIDEAWAAREANATCELQGRVWHSSPEHPLVLRGVSINVSGSAAQGDLQTNETNVPNYTVNPVNGSATGIDGWWWKAEREESTFTAEVPCDAGLVQLRFLVTGKSFFGDDFQHIQLASVMTIPEIFSAGRPPGAL